MARCESDRRVVITGRAINTPLGCNIDTIMQRWQAGESSFERREGKTHQLTPYSGMCRELHPLPDRKIQKVINRKDVIGLGTAMAAASDAGISRGSIDPSRIGMFVGAGCTQIGDLHPYFEHVKNCVNHNEFDSYKFGSEMLGSVSPMVTLQTLMNNTMCYASIALDIRGVNGNYMDFQASGLRAIAEGFYSIVEGRADVAIVGGIAATPEPFHARQGIAMGFLASTEECDPSKVIRPFDALRCGTILSEGSAFLVIESESHALRRRANIHGVIQGFSFANDAKFAFVGEQSSQAFARAIIKACECAGVSIGDVGLIVADANGGTVADRVEVSALRSSFGGALKDIPVTAPKSVFGEMSEASSVASIILGLELQNHQHPIPDTRNHYEIADDCQGIRLNSRERLSRDQSILLGTRSFSGVCAAMLVGAAK